MENSMEVPEQIQSQNYHMIQQSHTWIHIQKNWIRISKRDLPTHVQCSITHTSQDMGAT